MNAASQSAIRLHSASIEWTTKLRDERGAAMTEYGLLITFVAVAAMLAVFLFGGAVLEMLTGSAKEIDGRSGIPPAD